jgi:hypothetical protein
MLGHAVHRGVDSMRRVLAALAASLLAAAVPAAAQTADEVIAKSIEARGGLGRIKAVRSVRMSGRVVMGPSEMPIVVEILRGAGIRTEIRLPEGTLVQGFDGRTAWGLAPGAAQAELLPEDAARQMVQQADLEGVLVDYRAKGHEVTLVGTEKGSGGPLYEIRVRLRGGDVDHYFLDGRSWLPVRVESSREIRGERVQGETTIRDYQEAGGWKFPRSLENSVKGRDERQSIQFDAVEINPPIDSIRFRPPAGARQGGRPGR